MANAQQSHERINAAEVYDFRDGEMWLSDRPGIGVVVNRVTKIAEYDEYRAVMPMHSCPVGSFTILFRNPSAASWHIGGALIIAPRTDFSRCTCE